MLEQSDNVIKVHRINVLKGDGTDDALLSNINRPYTKTSVKATHNIDGTNIYGSEYAPEDIAGGNSGDDETDPDDPNNPNNPDTPSEVTDAEIIAALDRYCSTGIISECIPIEVDKNDISDDTWYVSKDSNDKITGAEYLFVYNRSASTSYITLGKVQFESAVSAKNLKDGNIGNVSYSKIYRFDYNPTIQETRAALTNAICDKVFGVNTSAMRYIKDNGNNPIDSLGEVRQFTVVEITEYGVKEISINIKSSSNDSEYISKLSNSSNYRTYSEKSYDISGTKITA